MSFDEFKKYLNALEDTVRANRNINEVLKSNSEGSEYYPLTCVDVVVDLLEEIFDDDKDWISYFCFGRDFGRVGHLLVEVGDAVLPFDTAEDLYDVLILSKAGANNRA